MRPGPHQREEWFDASVGCRASPGTPATLAEARVDASAPPAPERLAVGVGARFSPQHQQLLQQLVCPAPPAFAPLPLPLLRAPPSSSSSAESVSSRTSASASPPLVLAARMAPLRCARVRTLYACLGEGEGELSFEPNQILTNVAPSSEPGWLRGTLNGRTGLVPENYVEPLP